MTKFSILDLIYINENESIQKALNDAAYVAQHAEDFGYNRLWVAEHHNSPMIASAATSIVIGYLASKTKKIRVGAGGIMLPNHSPLVIAEQFGTLEALYPGRIDLGLGRAPGTDQRTLKALRRDASSAQRFPQDVQELQFYFNEAYPGQAIQAIPGVGQKIPIWILGSSIFGAQLAASLGLPYAFASHFAPDALEEALYHYRTDFRPSEFLKEPYTMMGVNICAADTDEDAKFLYTSTQQSLTDFIRGTRKGLKPPIKELDLNWNEQEKQIVQHMQTYSYVGSMQTIQSGLEKLIKKTKIDELMVVSTMHEKEDRVKSFQLISELPFFLRT